MKPSRVPADVEKQLTDGAQVIAIGVTRDQMAQGIVPVQAIKDKIVGGPLDGTHRIQIRIALEHGDLEAMKENPHLWAEFLNVDTIPPFMITAENKRGATSARERALQMPEHEHVLVSAEIIHGEDAKVMVAIGTLEPQEPHALAIHLRKIADVLESPDVTIGGRG